MLVLAAPSLAQTAVPPNEAAALSITGQVAHPQTFTAAELAGLPATTVEVSQATEHGIQHATYTGELLWSLLERAAPIDAPGEKTHLQHIFFARGRDGYSVALAMAEIDPTFEGKPVIIAYAQDGKPLPGLRLVVPNDKRAGRSVRDLAAIEVK